MDDKSSLQFSSEGENGISISSDDSRIAPEQAPSTPPSADLHGSFAALKKILPPILAVLLAGGLIVFAFTQLDFVAIKDTISAIGYEAPDELASVIRDINLTEEGERILKATRPEIQDAEAFNQSCTSNEDNTYTLGCYTNNRIYVYNVTNEKVSKTRQATLAHELLHAAWERLSDGERQELKVMLEEVLQSNEELQAHLELYDERDRLDELHSIVGTQIRVSAMPEGLVRHYARYFKDQDKVVAYYEEYSEPFRQSRERIKELEGEIAAHRETYDKMLAAYNASNQKLTEDVAAFNLKNQNYGFSTVEEFAAERQVLIERQQQLRADYDALNAYVEESNGLIKEYNSIVVRENELEAAINSNFAKPDEM